MNAEALAVSIVAMARQINVRMVFIIFVVAFLCVLILRAGFDP